MKNKSEKQYPKIMRITTKRRNLKNKSRVIKTVYSSDSSPMVIITETLWTETKYGSDSTQLIDNSTQQLEEQDNKAEESFSNS